MGQERKEQITLFSPVFSSQSSDIKHNWDFFCFYLSIGRESNNACGNRMDGCLRSTYSSQLDLNIALHWVVKDVLIIIKVGHKREKRRMGGPAREMFSFVRCCESLVENLRNGLNTRIMNQRTHMIENECCKNLRFLCLHDQSKPTEVLCVPRPYRPAQP